MNTIGAVLSHTDTLVTAYSPTAGFLMPKGNLPYYDAAFTLDLNDADESPAAPPPDVAWFGSRFDVGHALIRAIVKAPQAGDHRTAALNAKMASEIYCVRYSVIIADHRGDLLEEGVRSSGFEGPDQARRMVLKRFFAVQPASMCG
jgi:hypothetical protein